VRYYDVLRTYIQGFEIHYYCRTYYCSLVYCLVNLPEIFMMIGASVLWLLFFREGNAAEHI
jgi:hypothetical protein